jgi:hypothetical protein
MKLMEHSLVNVSSQISVCFGVKKGKVLVIVFSIGAMVNKEACFRYLLGISPKICNQF